MSSVYKGACYVLPISYVIGVVVIVVVTITRKSNSHVPEDSIPLNNSTNYHSTCRRVDCLLNIALQGWAGECSIP